MPELLVLLTLFDGKEIAAAVLYKDIFKRAYQSTPSKIKLAFITLSGRMYISKIGTGKNTKWQITPIGKDVLRGIMNKYLLNW